MSRKIDWTKPLSPEDQAHVDMWELRPPAGLVVTPTEGETSTDPDDDYDKWTKAELETEADARSVNIPAKSTKADVITLLREWDKANPTE